MTRTEKTAPSLRAMARPVAVSVVVGFCMANTCACAFQGARPRRQTCACLFPPMCAEKSERPGNLAMSPDFRRT